VIKGILGKESESFLLRYPVGNVDLIITCDVIANKMCAEVTCVLLEMSASGKYIRRVSSIIRLNSHPH